ncbi:MAG: ribosome small subunit-dependent GTPase A [Acidobacteriota bacterium]
MSKHEQMHEEHLGKVRKDRAQKKPPAPNISRPTALVIGVSVKSCTVLQNGETRIIRYDIPVAPGDEVTVRHEKVFEIAPRRTTLSRTDPANANRQRIIAANIDVLLIVAAAANPPFRPGLVDRYLIAAARGGMRSILCINKTDLGADTSAAGIFEIPTVFCSTVTGQGIGELRELIAGCTAVLAGHSGVGKSSLLNALASEERAVTGKVDEDTGTGRHTTTTSRLYELTNGARIIDTPGIREFGLGRLTLAEVQAAFPEFSQYACRFRDCAHRDDPDCAVREAGGPRYASYLRLISEL